MKTSVCFLLLLLLKCTNLHAKPRKVHFHYPVELLSPVTGSYFSSSLSSDKLTCFGNRDYLSPTYLSTLLCFLPYSPPEWCISVWGSRTVIIETIGGVELLKLGAALPHGSINNEEIHVNATRWMEFFGSIVDQMNREIIQIHAEPIYLCARSNDWRGSDSSFNITFRQAFVRDEDKQKSRDKAMVHLIMIIALSSEWLLPYIVTMMAAFLAYTHGMKMILAVVAFCTLVVCLLTPFILAQQKNRHVARLYFNYFFTRIASDDTRLVIRQQLPVLQAMFFSSTLVCSGSVSIYLLYQYNAYNREMRNHLLSSILAVSIAWFVFFVCRYCERFFRDWMWMGMCMILAHIMDEHLNPLSRDKVIVAAMILSCAILQCLSVIMSTQVAISFKRRIMPSILFLADIFGIRLYHSSVLALSHSPHRRRSLSVIRLLPVTTTSGQTDRARSNSTVNRDNIMNLMSDSDACKDSGKLGSANNVFQLLSPPFQRGGVADRVDEFEGGDDSNDSDKNGIVGSSDESLSSTSSRCDSQIDEFKATISVNTNCANERMPLWLRLNYRECNPIGSTSSASSPCSKLDLIQRNFDALNIPMWKETSTGSGGAAANDDINFANDVIGGVVCPLHVLGPINVVFTKRHTAIRNVDNTEEAETRKLLIPMLTGDMSIVDSVRDICGILGVADARPPVVFQSNSLRPNAERAYVVLTLQFASRSAAEEFLNNHATFLVGIACTDISKDYEIQVSQLDTFGGVRLCVSVRLTPDSQQQSPLLFSRMQMGEVRHFVLKLIAQLRTSFEFNVDVTLVNRELDSLRGKLLDVYNKYAALTVVTLDMSLSQLQAMGFLNPDHLINAIALCDMSELHIHVDSILAPVMTALGDAWRHCAVDMRITVTPVVDSSINGDMRTRITVSVPHVLSEVLCTRLTDDIGDKSAGLLSELSVEDAEILSKCGVRESAYLVALELLTLRGSRRKHDVNDDNEDFASRCNSVLTLVMVVAMLSYFKGEACLSTA